MYMVFIFTGGVGAAYDSAAVHATGATKSHSQMRCCKSARPALEIVSEQQQKRPLTSLPAFCPLLFCKSVRASSPDAGCASNCAVAGHSCAETPFRSGHSCRA